VPVERPVVLAVRVSVCVAVELWVREPVLTLVNGSVRTPVEAPVEPVATAVTVWVADLVPVPVPVLLRVVWLVVVEVNGAVTVDVPEPLTHTLVVRQA
jgi:hypothetical protein